MAKFVHFPTGSVVVFDCVITAEISISLQEPKRQYELTGY